MKDSLRIRGELGCPRRDRSQEEAGRDGDRGVELVYLPADVNPPFDDLTTREPEAGHAIAKPLKNRPKRGRRQRRKKLRSHGICRSFPIGLLALAASLAAATTVRSNSASLALAADGLRIGWADDYALLYPPPPVYSSFCGFISPLSLLPPATFTAGSPSRSLPPASPVPASDTDDASYVKPVPLPLAPNDDNSGDASCGSPAPPLLLPLALPAPGIAMGALPGGANDAHIPSCPLPHWSPASPAPALAPVLPSLVLLAERSWRCCCCWGVPDFLSLCVSGLTVASCPRGGFDGAAGTATATGSSSICSSVVALRPWPASFVDAGAGPTLVASSAGPGLLSSTTGAGIVLPVRRAALLAYVGAGASMVLLLPLLLLWHILLLTYDDGTPTTVPFSFHARALRLGRRHHQISCVPPFASPRHAALGAFACVRSRRCPSAHTLPLPSRSSWRDFLLPLMCPRSPPRFTSARRVLYAATAFGVLACAPEDPVLSFECMIAQGDVIFFDGRRVLRAQTLSALSLL
ncbi:hypothetical protein DFH07DRAFT_1065608 [Mycena maculata]|uniref:Uncharacterized protein n=1 Tax=Mycena maculata TaxID=230809 RepID=A0AAD7I0I7_9AGAR|nr:hypothetical protein DFH07DRAFT_1065608 [Mycena maculata]